MAMGSIQPAGFSFPNASVASPATPMSGPAAIRNVPVIPSRYDTTDKVTLSNEARSAAGASAGTAAPQARNSMDNGQYGLERQQLNRARAMSSSEDGRRLAQTFPEDRSVKTEPAISAVSRESSSASLA